MTEFNLTSRKGVTYFKEDIQRLLELKGGTGKSKGIANARSVLLFPRNASYDEILTSLDIIKTDIKFRLKMQKAKKKR